MDDVVDLSISHIPEQARPSGLRRELLRQLIKQSAVDRGEAAVYVLKESVLAPGAASSIEFPFWRVDTSAKLRGSSPRALQRST